MTYPTKWYIRRKRRLPKNKNNRWLFAEHPGGLLGFNIEPIFNCVSSLEFPLLNQQLICRNVAFGLCPGYVRIACRSSSDPGYAWRCGGGNITLRRHYTSRVCCIRSIRLSNLVKPFYRSLGLPISLPLPFSISRHLLRRTAPWDATPRICYSLFALSPSNTPYRIRRSIQHNREYNTRRSCISQRSCMENGLEMNVWVCTWSIMCEVPSAL